jgi:hypothetical protein
MDPGGWLRSLGLEQYEAAFREIDGTVTPLQIGTVTPLQIGGRTALSAGLF